MSFAIYPSLKDRSVLVTGGASGIGAAIVRAFAEQGSKVGFVDFDVAGGEALAAALRATGARVTFEPCDLRDIDALVDYRARAPFAARAHPTEEHYLPLLVAIGASDADETGTLVRGGMTDGVLSMDSFLFGAPNA